MGDICRICLDSANAKELISPCACKGTQQYVHRDCLLNWQETAMDTFLTRPSRLSFVNFNICNICKTAYNLYSVSRKILYFSPQIEYLLQRYRSRLIFLLIATFLLLFYVGFLIILLTYIITLVILCYKYQMRPQLNNTSKGFRLGLIMFGKPVSGLAAGIILEASPSISKGIFAGSKILMTEYSIQKAVGLIVNKGLKIANKEIKLGGPVKLSNQNIIHNDPNAEGSRFIVNGLFLNGRVDISAQGVRVLKVNGQAEWGSLQLDGEVGEGSWIIKGFAQIEDIFPD